MEPLKPELSHNLIIDDRHISCMHSAPAVSGCEAFKPKTTINLNPAIQKAATINY